MSLEITTAEKIRRLPWNTAFQGLNSVYAQLTFFGSGFVLFLNELHANNAHIGLLLAFMPFTGVVALFVAPLVARYGYRRTYVTFFGIRKVITAGLLLVPWVIAQYGYAAALGLVTAVTFGFALCRSIAETGWYPWIHEIVPDALRGKHAAINDMVARVTGLAAVAVGGYVLGLSTGIDRFVVLFVVALFFGVAGVWSVAHLPGGAPIKARATSYRGFFEALRDHNFTRYLLGLGLSTFAGAPLAYIPIFMSEKVGLTDSQVVWLQIGTIGGGLAVTYLLGWAADRYGSKPIMVSGLAAKTLLPLSWLLMPRQAPYSLAIALGISVVWGMMEIAWALGYGRLLFTRVVPSERRGEYMAVFYASIGLIGGVSQIFSGVLLDATAGISGDVGGFVIDQFTPLFIGSIVLNAISLLIFRGVNADSDYSTFDFANMFLHGNPVLALQNVMRYYRARDERTMVEVTERMGHTNSPLAVDELLEALSDPRFSVRFEAIYAISHMHAEPRLTEALCDLLDSGTELSLSTITAWGLGRIGDPAALPTLHRSMDSPWRSIQAHTARALGMLGDTTASPLLLARMENETDKGLRIAYASALGHLRYEPALDAIFRVLQSTENKGAGLELGLAVARIFDGESQFIRLHRGLRGDPGTAISQSVTVLRRSSRHMPDVLAVSLDACAAAFARNHFEEGIALLAQSIALTRANQPEDALGRALDECAAEMTKHCMERREYIMLALIFLQMMLGRD